MKKINNYIRNLNFIASVCILSIALIGVHVACEFIQEYCFQGQDILFTKTPNERLNGKFRYFIIFEVITLGPMLETLICQTLPYFICLQFQIFLKYKYWIVIISGLGFGLLHFYSLSYIIVMFITGMFFMYTYIIKYGKHGYWATVCLHAVLNAFTVLVL
jgi:hypothetical protein